MILLELEEKQIKFQEQLRKERQFNLQRLVGSSHPPITYPAVQMIPMHSVSCFSIMSSTAAVYYPGYGVTDAFIGVKQNNIALICSLPLFDNCVGKLACTSRLITVYFLQSLHIETVVMNFTHCVKQQASIMLPMFMSTCIPNIRRRAVSLQNVIFSTTLACDNIKLLRDDEKQIGFINKVVGMLTLQLEMA